MIPLSLTTFDDINNGQRLLGSAYDVLTLNHIAFCAKRCNEQSQCKSINFCMFYYCELNSEDHFRSELAFSQNGGCSYIAMRKDTFPVCFVNDISMRDFFFFLPDFLQQACYIILFGYKLEPL